MVLLSAATGSEGVMTRNLRGHGNGYLAADVESDQIGDRFFASVRMTSLERTRSFASLRVTTVEGVMTEAEGSRSFASLGMTRLEMATAWT